MENLLLIAVLVFVEAVAYARPPDLARTLRALRYVGSASIFLVGPAVGMAQQAEPEVQCVKGPEIAIEDGEHTVDCEINPGSDVDVFTFAGEGGDLFRFSLADRSNASFDPRIEIRDPLNVEIRDDVAINANLQVDVDLVTSGEFLVLVSDDVLSDTTDYRLELNCLFGSCPVTTVCFPSIFADGFESGDTSAWSGTQ